MRLRDDLALSIGFAPGRSRDLLRRLVREHAPDEARRELAGRVVDHRWPPTKSHG